MAATLDERARFGVLINPKVVYLCLPPLSQLTVVRVTIASVLALADMADGAYEHFELLDPDMRGSRPLTMNGPSIVTRIRELMARESAASRASPSENATY